MHDENGKFGLRVTNIRGDKWIAYGDGMLHKSEAQFSVQRALSACVCFSFYFVLLVFFLLLSLTRLNKFYKICVRITLNSVQFNQ